MRVAKTIVAPPLLKNYKDNRISGRLNGVEGMSSETNQQVHQRWRGMEKSIFRLT